MVRKCGIFFFTFITLEILRIVWISTLPVVRAETYVEGHITADTTWTTLESPYIVINDVIVDNGVKLSIQEGVEIRFGEGFSLEVYGSIHAVGLQNNPITFTSNKLSPSSSDWEGIKLIFSGDSIISHSLIQYGDNGIYIASTKGSIDIEYSQIRHNNNGIQIGHSVAGVRISQNDISENYDGIEIKEGEGCLLESNHIHNNLGRGIYITGSEYVSIPHVGHLTIDSNNIHDNEKGISVSRAEGINITSNVIYNNEIGITTFDSKHIRIELNSIRYNTEYGVYWGWSTIDSNANYNDIFENAMGMDIHINAWSVNADHNYWGDPSGPYHESLNPKGKGDSVGGDGTDLHFIPWEKDFIVQPFPPPDTTPPNVSIISPRSKTYTTADISLTFTVDEPVSWMAYSLDNEGNVTITGNKTLSGLSDGSHNLVVYAKDIAGNTGASELVHFDIKIKQTPQQSETSQIWIIALIVVIALVGIASFAYFRRPRQRRFFCQHCGAENQIGAVFCHKCGEKL